MIYPSLLYTSAPSETRIERQVFEDLKLDLLLSERAIEAMGTAARAEDIPVRQELFVLLEGNKALRAGMKQLARNAEDMFRLDAAYKAAACDNERYYLYFNLINAEMLFYRNARRLPAEGALLKRFTDFFTKAFEDPRCRDMEEETSLNFPKADLVRVNALRMKEDNMRIRAEDPTTIVSRLKKCAEELGLPESREKRDVSLKLKPRLVNALATLYPDVFRMFRTFYEKYSDFYDPDILRYRAELNLYLEITALLDRVRAAGMPVCLPRVSAEKKVLIRGARDVTLLAKNVTAIVPNDVEFTEAEPFCYLTGANGGGKTTYLRALGLDTVLFLSGAPLPCDEAELWPVTGVYTHFPRDERFEGDGRFADEQARVAEILSHDLAGAMVLLNETYSTTNEALALEVTAELAEKLFDLGSFGLYITHQHGLESGKIPFLSVIVDEADANRRTYRIERRRGASDSFAMDILKKYGLTAEKLRERFTAQREGGEA